MVLNSYLVQLTWIDDHDLKRISTVLAEFHTNKQAILDAGFCQGKGGKNIDNWYILKLELMQSIAPSIRNTGVSLQWTADTMEHAHITEIKDPTRSSNNNHYDAQICRHLDHADKCCCFGLTASLLDQSNQHAYPDEEDDNKIDVDVDHDHDVLVTINHHNYSWPITDYFAITQTLLHKDVGTIPWPLQTFIVAQHVAVHLAYDPSIRAISIDNTALKFNLPNLRPALADFLRCEDTYRNDHIHTIGGARRAKLNASLPFDKLQVWFKLWLQDMDIHKTSIVQPAQTLNCAPPCGLWTSGQYDTVIINHNGGYSWPTDGLRGHSVAQIRLIVCPIGKRGTEWPWKDRFLSYVQQFDIGDHAPATKLHLLKRAKWLNGTWIGDIIPVTQFRVPINIVPCFGSKADNHLTLYNSIEHLSEFWLNRYWDKNTFFPLLM
ncbi:uncharacterized protein BJ212DRAFT_1535057 [Suillus subaureus]|uniref:DUF6830 domain-containing protein n=1 Tax=Suillus subaureus TaxID=48587 RepID=A0A9P7E097_9AGAM|nr:uncharacterized protein BJ212DRAFT_1535057 [Suillus subaureus]KAG1807769.1 hypothetical protein BJ212DRAFT_1535057 [Suillus subaureus]